MDHYELLGVRRNASSAELRRAYQKLARRLHPDLNPGDPLAAERYRAVTEAFQVLQDKERRAAYDRGERKEKAPPPVAAVGFEGFDFSIEAKSGPAFRELFESVLRGTTTETARGEDLEARVRLAFDEAMRGAERRIDLVRQEPCPACGGAGELAASPTPCPRCLGSGQLRSRRGHMIFSQACPDCAGAGRLTRRACARCSGEGRVLRSDRLEVRIPPGVADGERLRLTDCGNAGRRGGPAGDLVLSVEVEPHPYYRREGDDLVCTLPVTMIEAALGAHVDAPTPEGSVAIEIPAGTQTGQRFRLRKRGVPRPEGPRGDLYVEVKVVIPAVTDSRSRQLLEEVARREAQEPRRDAARRGAPAGSAGRRG
jgi:molecular chaperone DnaJ